MTPLSRAMRGSGATCRVHDSIHGGLEALEGFREAAFIVCFADEPGFARVRFAEHTQIVQFRCQGLVEGVIAGSPIAIIPRRRLAEEQSAHRWMSAERVPDPSLRQNLTDANAQARAVLSNG